MSQSLPGIVLPPRAWFLAARPKTLTAAIVPILVGTILAMPYGLSVSWFLALSALFSATCIQIAMNIINDALDFEKGTDTSARIGPIRPTQVAMLSGQVRPMHVLIGGFCFLLIAFSAAIPLMLSGGLPLIAIVLVSMLCAYLYTGGPFPLSYIGAGDIFVVLFFGFVATGASFYVQTGMITPSVLVAGLQIGLLATVMIAINNLRDHEGDAAGGRRTLPVRFGIQAGRIEITFCVLMPFVLNMFWWIVGMPAATILPMLALPIAWLVLHNIWRTSPSRQYNKFLGFAALLHLSFGSLLALGILFSAE